MVHHAEHGLRLGIALIGEWPEVPQRRCVVLLLICGLASLEVRGERRFGLGLARPWWPVALGTELLFYSGEVGLRKVGLREVGLREVGRRAALVVPTYPLCMLYLRFIYPPPPPDFRNRAFSG